MILPALKPSDIIGLETLEIMPESTSNIWSYSYISDSLNSLFYKFSTPSSAMYSSDHASILDSLKSIFGSFSKPIPALPHPLVIPTFKSPHDIKNVVIIGVHGWFPGTILRRVLGDPVGTSSKFATMVFISNSRWHSLSSTTFRTITIFICRMMQFTLSLLVRNN